MIQEIVFYTNDQIHSKLELRPSQPKKPAPGQSTSHYLNKNFDELWEKYQYNAMDAQRKALSQNQGAAEQPKLEAPFVPRASVLLADKYRPMSLHDLVGSETFNREILKWFKGWRDFRDKKTPVVQGSLANVEGGSPVLQPALLWGPPGTGKTTFATTLAKVFNYQPYVINTSDERNGPELFQKLKNVYSTQSLFAKCETCASRSGTPGDEPHVCRNAETLIILDEVDGVVNSEQNSAIHFLLEKIIDPKTNRCTINKPIIFICNNIYIKGLRDLRMSTRTFQFKKDDESVFRRIKEVLTTEKFLVDDRTLKLVCANFSHDIRAIFNYLELFLTKGSYNSDALLKNLTAHDDQHRNYYDIMSPLFFGGNNSKINFYYTDTTVFDGLFLNYLKFDKATDLKMLDRCLSEFIGNDAIQTLIRTLGSVGYSHQRYGYSIVPFVFHFLRQKRTFSIDFPSFLMSYKRQRKEKHEIQRTLTEELPFPRSEGYKYIDPLFKALHISLKSMHLMPYQQKLLVRTIRLLILLGLQIKGTDSPSLLQDEFARGDSNSFFKAQKPGGVSFTPEINRLFEYQGLIFPLKFTEQSVILINSKYELVKSSHYKATEDEEDNSGQHDNFFQPHQKKQKAISLSEHSSVLRYLWHEPSENGVEYPLRFDFFVR
jgi:DNA polymerase III delta prime subunit